MRDELDGLDRLAPGPEPRPSPRPAGRVPAPVDGGAQRATAGCRRPPIRGRRSRCSPAATTRSATLDDVRIETLADGSEAVRPSYARGDRTVDVLARARAARRGCRHADDGGRRRSPPPATTSTDRRAPRSSTCTSRSAAMPARRARSRRSRRARRRGSPAPWTRPRSRRTSRVSPSWWPRRRGEPAVPIVHVSAVPDARACSRTGCSTPRRPTRSDAAGFTEDVTFRGLHPMIARRLQMWRLSNFEITRLGSPDGVYVFDCIARTNPSDERLIAVAEIRDVTPVRGDDGRVLSLPGVETVLISCLEGIRRRPRRAPRRRPPRVEPGDALHLAGRRLLRRRDARHRPAPRAAHRGPRPRAGGGERAPARAGRANARSTPCSASATRPAAG